MVAQGAGDEPQLGHVPEVGRFHVNVEFVITTPSNEEGADDFLPVEEDARVVLLEVFAVRTVPVVLKLLGRHELVLGYELVDSFRIVTADGFDPPILR